MRDDTYNGWTNYETWVWQLWITNDQGEYDIWIQEAKDWIEYESHTAVKNLADQLESAASAQAADIGTAAFYEGITAGPFLDLIKASISQINWREIAQMMINSVAERETHQ